MIHNTDNIEFICLEFLCEGYFIVIQELLVVIQHHYKMYS